VGGGVWGGGGPPPPPPRPPPPPPRPLVTLFEGASGTGKTLAAHWLATSIGSVVQRVDLGQVVSKYVGETEKNLDLVFGSARASGAVLLFDEADALLGGRTAVRDSHDRYANTETGLLLQRLERHDGVTVLTSNFTTRIDPSLLDRAKAVVVAFPLPPR
jgi:SpoVK/Ycf46/Vps4 family AAA+-type ATPase